jgi:predicted transcriptional regulator of viral defense system
VYLTDILEMDLGRRDKLVDAFTSGYSKLDPTRGDEGHHTSEYRLLVNVPEEEIIRVVGGGS